MTREEFIQQIALSGYSYSRPGNKVVVYSGNEMYLNSIKSIPSGVIFKGESHIYLSLVVSIPVGVEFKNQGSVYLGALTRGWFGNWEGNRKGIGSNKILNKMIADGLFNRER